MGVIEAQRLRLHEQLAALDAAKARVRQPFSAARLRKVSGADWMTGGAFVPSEAVARQIPMKLIDGRLVFTAHSNEQVYRFRGTATLGHLLAGLVVVGGDSEPSPLAWRPQRALHPYRIAGPRVETGGVGRFQRNGD